MRICFLASSIPSKEDAYDGDYVLRHAICISLTHEVSVYYAIETALYLTIHHDIEYYNERLTIHRIYLPARFKKWLFKRKYYNTLTDAIVKDGPFDIIHANIHWRAGYLASQLSKKLRIPYVLSEHIGYFNTRHYKYNSVNQYHPLKKYLVKKGLRNAALVLPVSETLGKWIQEFEPKVKVRPVSNVVFENEFYYTEPATSPFTFIHASGLSEEKNLQVMLDAILILAKEGCVFKFRFVTPLLKKIEDFKSQHGLEEIIECTGVIPHHEMAGTFHSSHCNVLVSSSETQGCVILESLCSGRPNIVSNIETFQEMIHPSNGLFSELGNPSSLAQCMKEMIERYTDYDLKNISLEAQKKFGSHAINALFTSVYEDVLGKLSRL